MGGSQVSACWMWQCAQKAFTFAVPRLLGRVLGGRKLWFVWGFRLMGRGRGGSVCLSTEARGKTAAESLQQAVVLKPYSVTLLLLDIQPPKAQI